ncbi:thioesterase II family protein [Paenibacillus lutrae]|uniref:Thioesterase n=1 Tax=Paenibacillus lutrae TaxID=2078573 RepID=A0A7X3JY71_9BACL|nr:thioesterase domain-containing protein [Paenibacillus lutrae]MVO98610.1 thioesterase [Paenibacillus lutrae]
MERIKLFCLPYAGGSAMMYKRWSKLMDSAIELAPIELANRGTRSKHPHYDNLNQAVDDLYKWILPYLDGSPFAFFGHSMGSLLSYELIHRIKESTGQEPIHAFFSGRNPPHILKEESVSFDSGKEEFLEDLRQLGGMPVEILESEALLDYVLPIIRGDFKMMSTYSYVPRSAKFEFNISALGGKEDKEVPVEDLREWAQFTNRECSTVLFEGGHFFINELPQEIVSFINRTLVTALLTGSGRGGSLHA